MSLSEKLKKFCNRYSINILSDNKRCAVMPARRAEFTRFDEFKYTTFQSEPMLTVDIPLSKLEKLEQIESIFYGNISSIESRRMFEQWFNQQEEERRLRKCHPAAEKAYQEYQAMLLWCGRGDKKSFTIPSESE